MPAIECPVEGCGWKSQDLCDAFTAALARHGPTDAQRGSAHPASRYTGSQPPITETQTRSSLSGCWM